jgi:hypothetical protein
MAAMASASGSPSLAFPPTFDEAEEQERAWRRQEELAGDEALAAERMGQLRQLGTVEFYDISASNCSNDPLPRVGDVRGGAACGLDRSTAVCEAENGGPSSFEQPHYAVEYHPLECGGDGTFGASPPGGGVLNWLFKSVLNGSAYQKSYVQFLSKLRPWWEFVSLSMPAGDLWKRLETNLTYYRINYLVVVIVLMVGLIVVEPTRLLIICGIAVVWAAFLKMNDDPNWEVQISGHRLSKKQRLAVFGTVIGIVLLCVVSRLFFSAGLCCTSLVLLHAIVHSVPETAILEKWRQFDENMI